MSGKQIKKLKAENEALKEKLVFFEKRCERIEANYDQLLHHVKQLMRDRFGSHSERYIDPNSPQKLLFNDESDDAEAAPTDSAHHEATKKANNIVTISSYQRCKNNRSDNLKHLPRRQVVIPVDERERICWCGKQRELLRYEIGELLNYQPAVYEIIEEQREVVACPDGCDGSVKIAPAPKRVLPKVLATASFLANIVVSKVDDRQPLYHQEQQFKQRYQFYLSRQSLAQYFIETAKVLQPLVNLAKDEIIAYDVGSCDATSLQVLQEPGRPAKRKSYVYCMRGGPPGKTVILYNYNAIDHKRFICDWFEGFNGTLHVDADPFFDRLACFGPVRLSYCNAHARRKFEPTATAAQSDGLAKHVMKLYQSLYQVERQAKNQKMTANQRYLLR